MAEGILVIGPRWVGDMVMAQCLLSALKELYPAAPIDVMAPAWAAPLISRMPEARGRIDAAFKPGEFGLADRFKVGRSLSGRYGRAYVLPGSWKSALVPFFAGIPTRVGFLREMRYGRDPRGHCRFGLSPPGEGPNREHGDEKRPSWLLARGAGVVSYPGAGEKRLQLQPRTSKRRIQRVTRLL